MRVEEGYNLQPCNCKHQFRKSCAQKKMFQTTVFAD